MGKKYFWIPAAVMVLIFGIWAVGFRTDGAGRNAGKENPAQKDAVQELSGEEQERIKEYYVQDEAETGITSDLPLAELDEAGNPCLKPDFVN